MFQSALRDRNMQAKSNLKVFLMDWDVEIYKSIQTNLSHGARDMN